MTVDEFLTAVSGFKGGTKDLQILVNSGHVEVEPLPLEDEIIKEGASMAS
tara:strand:- start:272 stop:421 length:150 start_codon:yes stop_codon:yes gene_type:complete